MTFASATACRPEPQAPPRTRAHDGSIRRVGVELEYGGVDCGVAAGLIRDLWGGRVVIEGAKSVRVCGSELGDFKVELDWSAAHLADDLPPEGEPRDLGDRLKAGLATVIGNIGTLFMPYEVVAPPIPWCDLGAFDRLVDGLRALGASDTRSDPTHAYAMQLNPEIASREVEDLVALLRAYLLRSEAMREAIGIDFTRRLIQLAQRFPESYRRRVLDPSYAPDLGQFMADYVEANPSRNRELDLLPLFRWLDEAQLARLTDLKHVKARPTWHWRLPNSLLTDPAWNVAREWNRWVEVERLAEDRDRLRQLSLAALEQA